MRSERKSKGAICIATFSRASDLERCISAVVKARGEFPIPLIVIHQRGHQDVSNVVSRWKAEIQISIESDPQGATALENINLNGILGREIAFTWLNVDWCLGVEDDVVISADAVTFILQMYNKFQRNPFFRGVNLGSKNPYSANQRLSYSKISFGVHGQASMVTKRTWKHFNVHKLRRNSKKMGLDAMMEHYVKTGFMCTPVNSKYLDNGWNGTHSSPNPNDIHYSKIRESFGLGGTNLSENYQLVSTEIDWRKDSKLFSYKRIIPTLLSNKAHHYIYLCRSLKKRKLG